MEGGPNIQEADYYSTSSAIEEKTKDCGYNCCDPRGKCHRFIALMFMCFLGFGSYFCYDNPAALHDYFKNELDLSETEFMTLYSLYSWPNVVLCFIGGFLIDRVFGIALGTNIYMFLTLIGHLIFAYGAYFSNFWIMCSGRFIFGIGAESLAVAQNNYAVLWFKGKELNMVFGIQLSLARAGSAVNFWVMEPIYRWVAQTYSGPAGVGTALFIASITCLFSMICALCMGYLNQRAERILRTNTNSTEEMARLTDAKDFPLIFWLVSVICVAYYVSIFPFIAQGKDFFMQKFHMEQQTANTCNSMIYFVSAICSPLFGLLIDKVGKNLTWVVSSILVTAGAHAILNFTLLTPYVGMIIMGLAYSLLASALWPLIALVIPEYQLGTAYGIAQSVQNLGLAVISIVAGLIVHNYGYFWLEIFFLSMLGVAVLAAIFVWILNNSQKRTLNMTAKQREGLQIVSQDKEALLKDSGNSPSGDMIPSSDFQIRNRYLSRIGAPLPTNFNSSLHRGLR